MWRRIDGILKVFTDTVCACLCVYMCACVHACNSRLLFCPAVGEDTSGGWAEYRTPRGYTYYYNSATEESHWGRPENFQGSTHDLTKDEIQSAITKVTADFDRWTLLEANTPLVVQLQARWRGMLVRRTYQARLQYLRDNADSAVALQAHWRGYRQRKAYQERLAYLNGQAATAVKVGVAMGVGSIVGVELTFCVCV